ncbi:MAG: DUF1343 domain-containing protein [Opitutales bacterium]|nr:DUF1343 domain-containing protein [Opitutales bacterium]
MNCFFLKLPFIYSVFLFLGILQSVQAKSISLGIDYLEQLEFSILKGKKVGLLTHPAGRNNKGISTVEVFRDSKEVELVALFGPEHGIYGDEKASVPVEDKIDHRTGLPVFSLYGKFRKPTVNMLSKIDVLVIDLQDVGVRCYTYISCMRYAMEACFENDVEVVVLDRPNPLGGQKVAGPMIDEQWMSYVGAFPMPFVHGVTIAELALWSKKTLGVLQVDDATRKKGKLTIVPMKGWERDMTWPQTGLVWFPTSPNIPTLDSVAGYPMTGLGAQLGKFRHGIGTKHPFRFLTFDGKDSQDVKIALDNLNIPGLSFELKTLSNTKGEDITGVYIVLSDWNAWNPTDLAFHMMQLSALWEEPSPFGEASESESKLFNKHVGSTLWWNTLIREGSAVETEKFITNWKLESQAFRNQTSKYLLY